MTDSTQYVPPTPERPMLLGLLVDVSGSMKSSIQNRSGRTINRLQGFQDSLDDLVKAGASLSKTSAAGDVSPLFRLFAYGFGFGNLLATFLGRGGAKAPKSLQGNITCKWVSGVLAMFVSSIAVVRRCLER